MSLSPIPIKGGLMQTLCGIGICSKYCKVCSGSGSGYGMGVGRLGGRRARAPRILAGRVNVLGIGDAPHVDRTPTRVRRRFVETLLWRPEVITDARGRAEVSVPLADGITTYRLFAEASTRDGLFGATALDLRVSQPFYVDFRLPARVSANDELTLGVRVHNHTARGRRVSLTLEQHEGVVVITPPPPQIALAPRETKVARLRLRFVGAGRRSIQLRAEGKDDKGVILRDAIVREVWVRPDGAELVSAQTGSLRGRGATTIAFSHQPGAIDGTQRARLSFDGGPVHQALDGLASILRQPTGCFEQTSSALYPNILVLDYLRRAKRSNRAIEKRALGYLATGYQRLLTFEVEGGGFSLYGDAPAELVLSGYGLMQFTDMARLRFVDRKLIRRTRRWIFEQQQSDGSWVEYEKEHAQRTLRRTAYLLRALLHSGARGKKVKRAAAYLRKHVASVDDAYTLALVLDALARFTPQKERSKAGIDALAMKLWDGRRVRKEGLIVPGPRRTLMGGAGRSADLETTALAAQALLRAGTPLEHVTKLVGGLVARRGRYGGWHTTQATILTLQAILGYGARAKATRGRLEVFVDGKRVVKKQLATKRGKGVHFDLSRELRAGAHQISLRYRGSGEPRYRLVGSAFLPYDERKAPRSADLKIRSRLTRAMVSARDMVSLKVSAQNEGREEAVSPMISVPIPPGVLLVPGTLAHLTEHKRVKKVQLIDEAAVLYLDRLAPGEKMGFELQMATRLPLKVRLRPAAIWEYYRPENRSEDAAQRLVVR